MQGVQQHKAKGGPGGTSGSTPRGVTVQSGAPGLANHAPNSVSDAGLASGESRRDPLGRLASIDKEHQVCCSTQLIDLSNTGHSLEEIFLPSRASKRFTA